jgi:sugar lactone lactonase YvrE
MKNHTIRLFAASANLLGEGPLWSVEEKCLWWIDVAQPGLWRAGGRGQDLQSWPLPKPPGSIAQIDAGRLAVAFRSGVAIVALPQATLEWLGLPGLELGDERFNDGKVDRAGRFWIGTMDRQLKRPIGRLYCLEGSRARAVDQGFELSNGIGWSPDNRTMYFSDTHARTIYAYDFDLENGTANQRRVFAQVDEGPGGPDGMTVDAEGAVWSAMFDRGVIHRYLPDGKLDQVVRLPVSRPTSCIFGGADLRTLFVTTARFGLQAEALAREPWAGGVLAIDLPYAGLAEPRFALA